jgi:hypothetical protein
MHNFLPELPDGYHWQVWLDGQDITEDYYAECEADEAFIWTVAPVAMVVHLTRIGDYGYWGADGPDHEGGLRKWQIMNVVPDGLHAWEQFETLAEVGRRIKLEPLEV